MRGYELARAALKQTRHRGRNVVALCGAALAFSSAALAQQTLPPQTVLGNMSPFPAQASAVTLPGLQANLFGIERPVADANYLMAAADRIIAYTSMTAARTVTLISASAVPPGTRII